MPPVDWQHPRVFISYSHDSVEHRQRVLRFSERLRAAGIDARIDQYSPWPAEGWPRWMENHLREADFVLMVCTETYHRRVTGQEDSEVGRGVCWEANLIYNDLYVNKVFNVKYAPVLFGDDDLEFVPPILQGHTLFPVDTEHGYLNLYRFLTNQPEVEPGQLGPRKVLPGAMPEPNRSLLKLNDRIPWETALRAFDAAEAELLSWPSRDGARDFYDCARILAEHEPVELADSHYHPLGVYLEDVARQVERSGTPEDVETAERLRQIVMSGPYEPCTVRGRSVPNSALAPEQALVLRIVRDVEGIEETPGSGDHLRVLPYQLNYECEPCPKPCSDGSGRCTCAAKNARLHFLGAYALETSTARLRDDLQEMISEWFAKFGSGLPARVQFFVSRAHAFQALNEGLDLMSVRLNTGVEDDLNAWAVTSYHIDERLNDETELGQLKTRLESRAATINIVNPADSLRQLADEMSDRDAVIMGEERPAYVVDCLQNQASVICALFPSPHTHRRNLSTVLRCPVPFVLLSRSDNSGEALLRLVEQTHCLRRFPHALKTEIASGNANASHIAAIVDLPEYGCNFDTADQEPIQNENL
jgi:SEFIR domain-containing protein